MKIYFLKLTHLFVFFSLVILSSFSLAQTESTGVTASSDIYFTARPDYRRCVSPLCGGYFVKAVNKKLTVCADGSIRPECYVASIEYGKNPVSAGGSFSNNTPLFLIGEIEPRIFPHFGNLGIFRAKLVARSATENTATATFYGVTNNGIVCITDPCFSYDQQKLNIPVRITKLSDINLEMSGATPDAIAKAYSLLATGEPLYASGKNQRYIGLGGVGVRFVAEQFYLPVAP
jgi:hypothetical protein